MEESTRGGDQVDKQIEDNERLERLIERYEHLTMERFLGYSLLHIYDKLPSIFPMMRELINNYTRGTNQWPRYPSETYSMVTNYVPDEAQVCKEIGVDEDITSMTFIQKADANLYTKTRKLVVCHICGENHFANVCPNKGNENKDKDITAYLTLFLQNTDDSILDFSFVSYISLMTTQLALFRTIAVEYTFVLYIFFNLEYSLNKNWILLDSQPTFNIFMNRDLVVDIHDVPKYQTMMCITNSGIQYTPQHATLSGYGEV
mmetsp:Transcript_240/g.373  ORF Transcript_240/g.373 Transcript_240/m.373 type:complete len:260 (-) Transcript_240:946-1725(-)